MKERMHSDQHPRHKEGIGSTLGGEAAISNSGRLEDEAPEANERGNGIKEHVQLEEQGEEGTEKVKHFCTQVPV